MRGNTSKLASMSKHKRNSIAQDSGKIAFALCSSPHRFVADGGVRAGEQQTRDELGMRRLDRQVQRRVEVLVLRVDLGAGVEKH